MGEAMAHAAKQEFAIIGLGRFGTSLALTLIEMGHAVLAIDHDLSLVQELADDLGQTVALDATDEAALRSVGIQSFATVVVAIGADFESNILVTALLKELGVQRVLCKALTQRQKTILLKVGADEVVLPEHEAGIRLARRLVAPDLIDELELDPATRLVQMRVPDALVGRTLRELDLPKRFGVMVMGIKNQTMRVVPSADAVLNAGDVLLLLGPAEAAARLEAWEP
jgi:trk system potassium uptake protein TrkA